MKILVSLPNWLGDIVMSTGFFNKLKSLVPNAEIDVIVKSELEELITFIPGIRNTHLITNENFSSLKQKYKFAKSIAQKEEYDIFFSLPDSFSMAIVGYFSGAKERVGYKNNFRSFLLTKSFIKPTDLHRVEEYILLLKLYFNKYGSFNDSVSLDLDHTDFKDRNKFPTEYMVFNATSHAESRSLPLSMALSLVNRFIDEFNLPIIFTGSKSYSDYYSSLISGVKKPSYCINMTGLTTLTSLTHIMDNSSLVVSTDSGPAHLANALNKKLLVLFGAGNEFNTGPYNKTDSQVIRTLLECTPCVSNKCKLGLPKCLLSLDEDDIINRTKKLLGGQKIKEIIKTV